MAKPRKKKRTHQTVSKDPSKKGDPKSFVFRRGRHGLVMADLEADLRKVMAPNTATHLRESKRNVLRDFVHIAGPLGVTHFAILTATRTASYLRIAKSPRGPTMTMRVHEYALMRDVAASQPRPTALQMLWNSPPLLVMNNFGGAGHLKLATVLFQNLFPTLNVTTVRLASCKTRTCVIDAAAGHAADSSMLPMRQRVVMLDHDKATGRIQFRHYAISVAPSGVSKGVKTLVGRRALPAMGDMADVSEFLTKSGYGSESEGEEAGEARVTLAQDLGRGNLAARQSRVQLQEIGPRMELEIVKVEEGLCDGKVLYHAFESKSVAEVTATDRRKGAAAAAEAERDARRKEQEDNVRRKAEAKAAAGGAGAKAAKKPWWQAELDAGAAERRTSKADDDLAAYRQEVGEEPEDNFSAGPSGRAGRDRPAGPRPPGAKPAKTQGRKQAPGEGIGGAQGLKKRKPGAARHERGGKKPKDERRDSQGGARRDGKQEQLDGNRLVKKRRRDASGGSGGGGQDKAGSKKQRKGSRT